MTAIEEIKAAPLDRAADFLEWYADFIRRDVMAVDIERHPYLPELEGVASDIRAALSRLAELEKAEPSLTAQLQQKCSDWGTYWRAPDAHGVVLTQDQALDLLRDALGVEVEFTHPAAAPQVPAGWQMVPIEPTTAMLDEPEVYVRDSGHYGAKTPLGWAEHEAVYRAMLSAAPKEPTPLHTAGAAGPMGDADVMGAPGVGPSSETQPKGGA